MATPHVRVYNNLALNPYDIAIFAVIMTFERSISCASSMGIW